MYSKAVCRPAASFSDVLKGQRRFLPGPLIWIFCGDPLRNFRYMFLAFEFFLAFLWRVYFEVVQKALLELRLRYVGESISALVMCAWMQRDYASWLSEILRAETLWLLGFAVWKRFEISSSTHKSKTGSEYAHNVFKVNCPGQNP